MKSENYIAPLYKLSRIDPNSVPRKISYSQWSMYTQCPKKWELSYIKKIAPYSPSIEQIFGTALHESLQHYLTILYTKGVKQADWIEFRTLLTERLKFNYAEAIKETGSHFSTAVEMNEYLEDGVSILEWFKKKRRQYFTTKNVELIGIELDLCIKASEKNNSVYWYGFLDVVIKDNDLNKIIIYDIKTSRLGWNKYQKKDKLKLAQLVAYKTYFSKQYNIPVDNIDVEFFIVKRKLQEDSMFAQKRIQQVKPASGSITRKQIQQQIDQFVSDCFLEDGAKREDRQYQAIAGKASKNCKYCVFKTDYINCPLENRIKQ